MTVVKVKTMHQFQTLLEEKDEKLLVIDFTATWCGPCKHIGPIFDNMADQNPDVLFAKVDVDQAHEVAAACGVNAYPTFQFFKRDTATNGAADSPEKKKCIEQFCGADEEKLVSLVQQLKIPGVSKSRESKLAAFFDACLSGNVIEAREYLQEYPEFASLPTPPEWHKYHILRRGWQPVESLLNPGVLNAHGTVFLRANPPSYGLHLAAGNGHSEIIKMLLEDGTGSKTALLEATDGDGDTALAWAAWSGRKDAMDQLLAAGADASFAHAVTRQQFEEVQGDGASLEYLQNMS